ncbi:radical SAM protein [bacterium]|nr:radical SAM protein [bacterium]
MKILMVVYDNDSYTAEFPMGLGYLASAIRNAGHKVEVYHQDVYHYPDEHLTTFLDSHDFDGVMVSTIGGYYQYRKLISLSKAINASKNRKHFSYMIGGHGPASAPEYFMKISNADFIGIGEGELTMPELLDAIENHSKPYSEILGIAYKDKDGKCVINPRRPLIQDIDTIAMPAYDLFNIDFYAMLRMPNIKNNERCMTMLSGRGCTFACNFCYRLDKGFRPRSAKSIIEEIEYLKKNYNITYIGFEDELLMSSKERTVELCQAFIDAKVNIRWECNGRLNYADIPTLEKMKEAGCVFINYGIESLDNDTLKVMHKGLTRDMIIKGIENTLKVGISPGLNIIYGNINEPLSAIDDAVEFLLKYDDHAQLRTLRPVTPYPGSELFDIAVEKGLVKDAEDFYVNKHTNSDLIAVNFTKYTDEEIYEALYKANTKLIDRYIENQKEKMHKNGYNLYMNRDASFRGFRQM